MDKIKGDKVQTIHELALEGDTQEVKRRVQEKPALLTQTDDSGRIPLHWAVSKGHMELTGWLLDQNKSVNAKDDSGWTPLIIAASAGHQDILQLLLDNGADVSAVTAQGRSSLLYAASKNREDIVSFLLSRGADVNIQDELGATALHRAAGPGHLAAVKVLLAADYCTRDIKDRYGNTPLHYACEEERTEVAKLLVKSGANIEIENKDEKTPLQMCSEGFAKSIIAK